ncbi:MAG: response regulator [Aggregatilineales bacterium]
MRIAYVEDNAMNLALVQRIAMMGGHLITSFTEGEIALTELARQPFDLILMDIELAGEMNGLQVVRSLRARGLTTPIVAVTAYAMLGDQEKTLQAGCNEYLPKPLPISDFLSLLARYEAQLAAKQTPVLAVTSVPPSTSATIITPPSDPLPIPPAPPVPAPVEKLAAPIPTAPVAAAHALTNGERLPESHSSGATNPSPEPSPVVKSAAEPQTVTPPVVPDQAKAAGS